MMTTEHKVSTPKLNGINGTNGTPGTPKRQSSNPLVLLVGKLVFLDLNSSYKPLSKVKRCLNLIGANIADCLSKDVDYVISNREVTPNLDTSLDTPKKNKTSPNGLNIGPRSNFINRTKSILEKASKGFANSNILMTARRLGIKVMNIDEIERYIEKYLNKTKKIDDQSTPKTKKDLVRQSSFQLDKLSSQSKIYKLKNPFLKIESICKQYKPIYQEFDTWHDINIEIFTSKNFSPFQIYFSDDVKADDENGDDHITSQTQQSTKNVFKSPTSSIQPYKSNVLLNCSNNYSTQQQQSVNKISQSKSIQQGMNSVKNKISLFNNTGNLTPASKTGGPHMVNTANTKRKPTGYCECCKQRYDNLKQHLTSVSHENFDRNVNNFKEIDDLANGVLNFKNFLIKNNLDNFSEKPEPEMPKSNVDIEETKEFAKKFNQKRQSLGISQTQVIQALNSYKEPVYDESALLRFERLDITPRSAAKMKPALEKWLNDTELKFGDRFKSFNKQISQSISQPSITTTPTTASDSISDGSKKRKRAAFSPKTLKSLNDAFNKNSTPSTTDIEKLSAKLKKETDEISVWFTDKRDNFKKIKKKFTQDNILNGLLDDSNLDKDSSFLKSSPEIESSNEKKIICGTLTQALESTSTKVKNPSRLSAKQTDIFNFSNNITPIRLNTATNDMSSPSAHVLFTLNSNSFTIPNETSMNNSHNVSMNTRALASRMELINSTTDLQTLANDGNHLQQPTINLSKSGDSTDLSCVNESVLHAFCNDFSYEIVQKL